MMKSNKCGPFESDLSCSPLICMVEVVVVVVVVIVMVVVMVLVMREVMKKVLLVMAN